MGQSKKQSQISFTICYILLYHGIGTEKMHFQPIKTAFFRLMRQKRDGVWSKSAVGKQKTFVCCPGRDSSGRALSEYAGYATINNRTGKSPPFISRVDGQASSAAGTGSWRADEKPVENRFAVGLSHPAVTISKIGAGSAAACAFPDCTANL